MTHARKVPRIVVVYFSATGTTAKLAEAIHVGATVSASVDLCQIVGDDIALGRFQNDAIMSVADAADVIVFGSPTYMGGPAAQFKAFADATSDRWSEQRWANKVAAGFTIGSCPNGDQTHTLTYFTVLAAQHGMLWCGLDLPGGQDHNCRNRLGSQTGLMTHTIDGKLPDPDLDTAQYLGRRLAKLAAKNCGGALSV